MIGERTLTEETVIVGQFRFGTGETLGSMNVHYRTLGSPKGRPVLLVHGTPGTGASFLRPGFANAMFGSGQPLDLDRYFVILPDAIGLGSSSKPSDGLRARFPRYDLRDMVAALRCLVRDHLGIDRLHLLMGDSMGGMVAWEWAVTHPEDMTALVPMACLPVAVAGRNRMMRRMLIDAVRDDPAWREGNYEVQPPGLARAQAWFDMATAGGEKRLRALCPTNEAADAEVDRRKREASPADANDMMYRWNATQNYDPSGRLERVRARVLTILSEDDERNPPILDVLDNALAPIPHAESYIIPATDETMGHLTTGSQAHLYAERLGRFLDAI